VSIHFTLYRKSAAWTYLPSKTHQALHILLMLLARLLPQVKWPKSHWIVLMDQWKRTSRYRIFVEQL